MKKLVFGILAAGVILSTVNIASADEPEGRIQKRKEKQQGRIAQGVASGQLTPGETAKLEHKTAKLNHEIRHDRNANGGNLTNKEKRQVNRQQNRLSKNIYKDKHNGATSPR